MSDYIKKLAEQAGFEFNDNDVARCDTENLERFAELVRADEREAWAKHIGSVDDPLAQLIANAIRAKG
jgi:hypothetical protein